MWHRRGWFVPRMAVALGAALALGWGGLDSDGDGVVDADDNCPGVANPDQAESEPEGSFGAPQIIATTGSQLRDVISADLDGDGDLDVIAPFAFGSSLLWYEKLDGDGEFGSAQPIPGSSGDVWAIAVADLDGDGDADLVTGSSDDGSGELGWHENLDGAGSFGQLQLISGGASSVRSVAAADLDGDADLDVAFADDRVAWFENLGGGSFGAEQPVSTAGGGPQSVVASDLDGDGDNDLLVALASEGRLAWYENSGTGAFGPAQDLDPDELGGTSALAADLDGDGDADVVANRGGSISWYENLDGAGGFGPGQLVSLELEAPFRLAAADLDGDGDQDLVAAVYSSIGGRGIVWQENLDGAGSFGPRRQLAGLAGDPYPVHPADLDGDGDVDLLAASEYGGTIYWHENASDGLGDACDICPSAIDPDQGDADADGTGDACDPCTDTDADGFGDPGFAAATCAPDICPALANPLQEDQDADGAGDACDACPFDPDDDLDADGVCGEADGCPATFDPGQADADADGQGDACDPCPSIAGEPGAESEPAGSFGTARLVATTDGATFADAADLDGDGDVDVVTASFPDSRIAWHPNVGGAFAPARAISSLAFEIEFVAAADLDGDGDADVLSGSHGYGSQWYENDGQGRFGPPRLLAVSVSAWVGSGDLDGDGDLDAVTSFGALRWHENAGGAFGLPHEIHPTGAKRTHTVDLDGDADADVLVGGSAGVRWFENIDGLGDFGPEQIITPTAMEVVHAADLDGDGDEDVLSGPGVSWYENLDGSGTFGPARMISYALYDVEAVKTADLDEDGDLDVIFASYYDDKVAWYENVDGAGNFGGQRILSTTAVGPLSIAVADLNGDGTPDLVGASYWDDTVAWYPNGSDGVGDACDNCPGSINADQADTDSDGSGDACDPCNDPDGDGFGHPEPPPATCAVDNCPATSNPSQSDADADGRGDACDGCPLDPQDDVDRDGACGDVDTCPTVSDPEQDDSDGDALGDACDNCPFDSNADQDDGDGDGGGSACDCNDADPVTHPGAEEVNDGLDNQCPGDLGHGVIDETSGNSGFHHADPAIYSWPAQAGAQRYQVARSAERDFEGCTTFFTMTPQLTDPTVPPAGTLLYYLNRPFTPHTGAGDRTRREPSGYPAAGAERGARSGRAPCKSPVPMAGDRAHAVEYDAP